MPNKPTLEELIEEAISRGPVHNPQQSTIDAEEIFEKYNKKLATDKSLQEVQLLKPAIDIHQKQ